MALLSLLLLAGCATTKVETVYVPVKRELPRPDARLTDPNFCGNPAAAAGADARDGWRAEDQARGCEAGRVSSWNSFYKQLQ